MVLVADVLYIFGIFPVYYGFLPVICSWSFVHQSSMFRVVDVLPCYVLLVIHLLSMNVFFHLGYEFFPVCHCLHPCSSLSDPSCYLQTPCVSADFFLSFTPGHLCITPVCSE